MWYLLRRALHAALLLGLISLLSFVFLQLGPGDFTQTMHLEARVSDQTVAAWRLQYGIDQPLAIKYWKWVKSIFRGEFGFSFAYGIPVGTLLWPRIGNTLGLTTLAVFFSWCFAIPIGAAAAASRTRAVKSVIRGSFSLLHSIPDLLIALALLLFALRTGIFAFGGLAGSVIALVLASLPVLVRHVEAALREAMTAPFIQAARAHGIQGGRLWWAYILPAAANPLISLFGYSIGGLLSSSLLVEVIMGWPGLGPLLLEAIFGRDLYVVIGATIISACFLIAGNLIADLLLFAVDPRVRCTR
jgi:peptide/nickel transport system permease protein